MVVCLTNDVGFQVMKTGGAVICHETNGDSIQVSHQNDWEIKFNIRTGAVESWKVVYKTGHVKLATFHINEFDLF